MHKLDKNLILVREERREGEVEFHTFQDNFPKQAGSAKRVSDVNTVWLCHSVLALSFLAEDLLAPPPPLPRRRVEEAAAARRDVRVLKEREKWGRD